MPSCFKEYSALNDVKLLNDFELTFDQVQMFVNLRNRFIDDPHPYFTIKEMGFFVENAQIFVCYNYAGNNVPTFLESITSELIANNTIGESDTCIENSSKRLVSRHCHILWEPDMNHRSLIPPLVLSTKFWFFHFQVSQKIKGMSHIIYDITNPKEKKVALSHLGLGNLEDMVHRVDNMDAQTIQVGILRIKSLRNFKKSAQKKKLSKKFVVGCKESLIDLAESRIFYFDKHLLEISDTILSRITLHDLQSKLECILAEMTPIKLPPTDNIIFSRYDMRVSSLYHFIVVECGEFVAELVELIQEYLKIDP